MSLSLEPKWQSPPPFLILALPRSRTRWLSEFLSWGPWKCTHEEFRHFRSMEDLKSWGSMSFVGSAETAVAPFWRLFGTLPQGVRVVVVRRSPAEVTRSLRRVMKSPPLNLDSAMTKLDAKLTQVERRVPGVLSVSFEDLGTLEGAKRVFEFALLVPFDEAWWRVLAPVNLQEPFTTFERYVEAFAPQLRRMATLAKGAILHDMTLHEVRSLDGVEFQEEPFGVFLRDGVDLFAEHSFAVGETSESFREKNIPYLQAKSDAGELQIVMARSNGRSFGYLMTELTVSREAQNRLAAVETTFFASPDMPGLGMRLQRETLRRLRSKGVSEVWFRAGPRGNGPKMSSMFRRLGAAPSGSLWRLNFDEGTP